jgi:manganese efflux pump family protein
MIYESTLMDKPQKNSTQGLLLVIGLAFATSIDALSVGISYSLLYFRILIPVLILGGVTFTASLAGILIGGYFGSFFQKKLEVIGGLILIAIGINILLQNYY